MHTILERSRSHPWTQRRVTLHGQILRVLIVDDNQNAAEALAAYFASEEMESRVALSGNEAIAVGGIWHPHVIVMDISMPDCSGFEAALALRRGPRTSEITILAFTALDETEVRRHLVDHEFDGYCQKGLPPTDLLALIAAFLP